VRVGGLLEGASAVLWGCSVGACACMRARGGVMQVDGGGGSRWVGASSHQRLDACQHVLSATHASMHLVCVPLPDA
jgi:hypothetical protein